MSITVNELLLAIIFIPLIIWWFFEIYKEQSSGRGRRIDRGPATAILVIFSIITAIVVIILGIFYITAEYGDKVINII